MKTIFSLFTMLITTFLFAQTEEQQKAWMEYMTPSEVHKKLAEDVGEWTSENTMWMEPGAEPIKSKGTATITMLLDGRYQQSTFEGDFMGTPMHGMSTLAFDNATKEFTSTWIDNFGTGMMVMKGKFDESQKQINFSGTMVDPMTGNLLPVRETYAYLDENTHKMEMFFTIEGKEFKSMEIIFKRVRKAMKRAELSNSKSLEVPEFENKELQKIAEEYNLFFNNIKNATTMGDTDKLQKLQLEALEWSTKISEISNNLSASDTEKFTEWSIKLAEQTTGSEY